MDPVDPRLIQGAAAQRRHRLLHNYKSIFTSVFLAAYGDAAMPAIYTLLSDHFQHMAGILTQHWTTTQFRCNGDEAAVHGVMLSWFLPSFYMRITMANSDQSLAPRAKSAARRAFYSEALRHTALTCRAIARVPWHHLSSTERCVLVSLSFVGRLCDDLGQ
ncbi:hypothetical protein C8A05DRAFT_38192 [Staphylotrichum tortipilum]|uniref:Uncharacterized protein n=1 Tax=Staphylotrichum tortipilum TaxID=2831512 RepID=A0AAN6RPH9_9PEZI|nr:hypothetical protein C8A05DRAFT_38192 [Staphylotrichum longicolle]